MTGTDMWHRYQAKLDAIKKAQEEAAAQAAADVPEVSESVGSGTLKPSGGFVSTEHTFSYEDLRTG